MQDLCLTRKSLELVGEHLSPPLVSVIDCYFCDFICHAVLFGSEPWFGSFLCEHRQGIDGRPASVIHPKSERDTYSCSNAKLGSTDRLSMITGDGSPMMLRLWLVRPSAPQDIISCRSFCYIYHESLEGDSSGRSKPSLYLLSLSLLVFPLFAHKKVNRFCCISCFRPLPC